MLRNLQSIAAERLRPPFHQPSAARKSCRVLSDLFLQTNSPNARFFPNADDIPQRLLRSRKTAKAIVTYRQRIRGISLQKSLKNGSVTFRDTAFQPNPFACATTPQGPIRIIRPRRPAYAPNATRPPSFARAIACLRNKHPGKTFRMPRTARKVCLYWGKRPTSATAVHLVAAH